MSPCEDSEVLSASSPLCATTSPCRESYHSSSSRASACCPLAWLRGFPCFTDTQLGVASASLSLAGRRGALRGAPSPG